MGTLVKTSDHKAIELIWVCICKAEEFGVQIKGRERCKLADEMTDKVLAATVDHDPKLGLMIDGKKFYINNQTAFNGYLLPVNRTLKTVREIPEGENPVDADERVPFEVFFERAEFDMLMEHVEAITPTQNRRKDWLRAVDLLKDCKTKYSGSEIEVREKMKGESKDGPIDKAAGAS